MHKGDVSCKVTENIISAVQIVIKIGIYICFIFISYLLSKQVRIFYYRKLTLHEINANFPNSR